MLLTICCHNSGSATAKFCATHHLRPETCNQSMDFAVASLLLPELQNMQDFCSTQHSQLLSTATKLPLCFWHLLQNLLQFCWLQQHPVASKFKSSCPLVFCRPLQLLLRQQPPPHPRLNFAAAKVKLLLQCKLGPFQTNKNACTITHFQQILSLLKTEAMM